MQKSQTLLNTPLLEFVDYGLFVSYYPNEAILTIAEINLYKGIHKKSASFVSQLGSQRLQIYMCKQSIAEPTPSFAKMDRDLREHELNRNLRLHCVMIISRGSQKCQFNRCFFHKPICFSQGNMCTLYSKNVELCALFSFI